MAGSLSPGTRATGVGPAWTGRDPNQLLVITRSEWIIRGSVLIN
jgi:hypothetical protein